MCNIILLKQLTEKWTVFCNVTQDVKTRNDVSVSDTITHQASSVDENCAKRSQRLSGLERGTKKMGYKDDLIEGWKSCTRVLLIALQVRN